MKYSGHVGYSSGQEEIPVDSGVWKDVVIERKARGDVLRNNRRLNPGDQANDDISIGNTLSLVLDPYNREHFSKILYARWMGTLWTVSTAEVEYPRLILTLGGEYHGPKAPTTESP